jgi:hypothetical protein
MPVQAFQTAPVQTCRITGRAVSGGRPLPGVSLLFSAGDAVKAATSTDVDGTFSLTLPPGTTYRLQIEFTGFAATTKEVVLAQVPCDQKIDIELTLKPPTGSTGPTGPTGSTGSTGSGRGAAPRFETLNVQANAATAAVAEVTAPPDTVETAARLLLPPGFSTEATQAVAVNGNMAQIDRGMMNDRMQAIGRGEVDPITGEFRPAGATAGGALFGDEFGRGGPGGQRLGGPGRGGPGGPGGRGGPGGPAGQGRLGGRGVQQSPYTYTANYTFGGSALDSAPYQLRPETAASKRPYYRNNYGGTIGGPVRIPKLYDGTRRTNFQFNYSGNYSGNLFDQYATVPTEAIRNGDFSGAAFAIVDPVTKLPFEGNRIPVERIDPAARVLLGYIPEPNLSGTNRNFHYTTTTNSSSNQVSVRITHNFSAPPAAGRGGPAGGAAGRGGAGGRAGGPGGGRGGRGNQGTTVNMNAQVQYRTNESEQVNVFPTLGGSSKGSSISVPVGLNIAHRRDMHAISVNFSRSTSHSNNRFAYLTDVAGLAGINGVSEDPFAWGVPSLSFSTFSSLRDSTPTRRSDRRLTSSYTFSRPSQNHTIRFGGEYSQDWSDSQSDPNARGTFVFTGLYSAGGASIPRGVGLDFADFLLGLPQQASIQFGPGTVRLRGQSFGAFLQDDWRRSPGLTFNLGVRYDFVRPYREAGGQMVNLDAAPGFTAVSPVVSGATGPFSGVYPTGLVNADANNLSPRVGVAWRAARATIIRSGYSLNYNAGSYASIARQLVGQPPFASTGTSLGTLTNPITITDPFANITPTTTTNNFGIDRNYVLGIAHTWNADITRELGMWTLGAGYVGTKGMNLDMLRAPNRGASGLLIPDVQSFIWQESTGSSLLAAGNFRIRRRPIAGIGFGGSYTLARSRDNTTATGGSATVAQDDRNLEAEWALSSFDRRHQLSVDAQIELPFGPNRRWLANGGVWASVLEGWSVNTTFTWNSGAPLTPRVSGAAADVARGTNGTLRASYNGQPIELDNPTIEQYFNTSAFTSPLPGEFGNALRNMIIGPGNRQLNASFSRDVRMGRNRTISIQLNANNLLNMVQWSGVDTNVNSLTFGQVTSVRPMRSMTLNLRFRF